ncbi:hypothetical protein [Georgenia sp. Z1491]|uniref:hypothetical protein n=1 Tax=Georgenia sp. Z1491 TaxID=3416707 RepID=UPI003CFA9020
MRREVGVVALVLVGRGAVLVEAGGIDVVVAHAVGDEQDDVGALVVVGDRRGGGKGGEQGRRDGDGGRPSGAWQAHLMGSSWVRGIDAGHPSRGV